MDEASDDFVVSSNGLRLKPKVVQVYEDVILKGKDPATLPFNFLLISPHESALARVLGHVHFAPLAAHEAALAAAASSSSSSSSSSSTASSAAAQQRGLRFFFYHCAENLRSRDPVRYNALLTLAIVFPAIFEPARQDELAALMHFVWGMDQVDAYFDGVLSAVVELLGKADEPEASRTRDAALRLLIAISSALKIHQNLFMDYFRLHNIFGTLLDVIGVADAPRGGPHVTPPLPMLIKISLLVIANSHYKKYDARNPYLDHVSKDMTNEQLDSMDTTIHHLLEMGRRLQQMCSNDGSSNSTLDSTPSVVSFVYDTAVEYLWSGNWSIWEVAGGVISAATGAGGGESGDGDEPIPPRSESTGATDAGPAQQQSPAPGDGDGTIDYDSLQLYSRSCTSIGLFLMYLFLANNNKFVVRVARLRRQSSEAAAGASGSRRARRAVAVVPTHLPDSMRWFLSTASYVFAQPMVPRTLMLARLCFIILRVMSEDTACNLVLHDNDLVPDTSADKPIQLCRRVRGVGGPGPGIGTVLEWYESDTSQPLICVVFQLLTDFLAAHAHRILTISHVHLSTLSIGLDVVYRFLCFELSASDQRQVGAALSATPGSNEALSGRYLRLATNLIKVIKVVATSGSSKKKRRAALSSTEVWHRLRHVMYQSSRLLHLFASLHEDIFCTTRDITLFVYELARHSASLVAFFNKAQKKRDGSLCKELNPVVSLARLFASKVDLFRASRGSGASSPITAGDVITLIERNHTDIVVPRVQINANYQRFVENPMHANGGEAAFFDLFVNDLLSDARRLYVDAEDVHYFRTKLYEQPFIDEYEERLRKSVEQHVRNEVDEEEEEEEDTLGGYLPSLPTMRSAMARVSRTRSLRATKLQAVEEAQRERQRRERWDGKQISEADLRADPSGTNAGDLFVVGGVGAVQRVDLDELGVQLVVKKTGAEERDSGAGIGGEGARRHKRRSRYS